MKYISIYMFNIQIFNLYSVHEKIKKHLVARHLTRVQLINSRIVIFVKITQMHFHTGVFIIYFPRKTSSYTYDILKKIIIYRCFQNIVRCSFIKLLIQQTCGHDHIILTFEVGSSTFGYNIDIVSHYQVQVNFTPYVTHYFKTSNG